MNLEKTEKYYRTLKEEDLCDCIYCRNYYRNVRNAYPELTAYLAGMGIDIEKPFEAMPLEPYEGMMEYSGVQYIVMGDASDFHEADVSGVHIEIAGSHPMTDIAEEHFVIEISPVIMKWTVMAGTETEKRQMR